MSRTSNRLKMILGSILLLGLVLIAWSSFKSAQPMERYRGSAIAQLPDVLPENLTDLGTLVTTNYMEYRANAARWSAAYFGCLFGAAFLSACAGVILKLESINVQQALRNDLAAVMAALAALLITLLTIGSFEEKWRSNRIAASDMENLAYDLLKPGAAKETGAILSHIQKINKARNSGIVGTGSLTESNPTPESSR